ncbi:ComF family protein [Candidatus Saccharibacteria bacterium]|nr:ComF family protein [Candidatus Saccharibacteria bacterium]
MPKIVKNTTFPGLFDLLAPHSCRGCGRIGDPLCNCCKNYIISHHQNLCPICHASNSIGRCVNCHQLPPIFIVGHRSDLIGQLVHDFKFHSVRDLARPLAEILNAVLPPTQGPTVIVPLPTITSHIRERGFSHTHLITKHFAKLRQDCQTSNLLTRARNTVQVGSSREKRLSQARTAYTLTDDSLINPSTTYILFDDVWTTGASLQSASALLQKAGAKNIIIAVLALSQ